MAFDQVLLPGALVGKKMIIFANVEVIFAFHERSFLPRLLKCDYDPTKIAEAFIISADNNHFDYYITFVINKKKAAKLCTEFAYFFKQLQKDRLGVSSFLLEPVQRLPRYQMLLGEILKELFKNIDDNKTAIGACCLAEKKIQRLLTIVDTFCE